MNNILKDSFSYNDIPTYADWSKTESVVMDDLDNKEIKSLFPFCRMLRKEYDSESDNVADIIREFFYNHNLRASIITVVSASSEHPYIKVNDVNKGLLKSVHYTSYSVVICKDFVIDILNQKFIRRTPNYFRELGRLNSDRKIKLDKSKSYVYSDTGEIVTPKGIKWLFENEYN